MQSLWLIIVAVLLLLIVMPIFTKIHVSYDVLGNMGAISLHVFFIKIFAYRIRIKNKNIVIITEKNKKEIETELSNTQMRFLEQLMVQFKQKIIVRKLLAHSRIGVNDAMNSALLCGLVQSVISSLFAYIKNTKKSAVCCVNTEPVYNGTCLIFSVYCSFALTLMDIIYSVLMSVMIIKRSEKYERV